MATHSAKKGRSLLSAGARRRRLIAMIAVVGALIAGTFWGDDDTWPFGPFRMYSIRNRLDGRVRSAQLQLTFADGTKMVTKISSGTVAMRRAEIEGQIDRFQREPSLLRHLSSTYEALHPDEPAVVGIRLYYEMTYMQAGRPHGPIGEVTMARWGAT